jgi:thermostable 8-oxoguanine DNA glycosylase
MKEHWSKYREQAHREWMEISARMAKEAQEKVQAFTNKYEKGEEAAAWKEVLECEVGMKRQMLQALHSDANLAQGCRHKLEGRLRECLREYKRVKRKPKGEFVKLLITHRGWNAAEVRRIIREPEVPNTPQSHRSGADLGV